MYRIRPSLVAAGLIVGLMPSSSATRAQPPAKAGRSGGFEGGYARSYTPASLLSMREIQKDLRLTGEQMKQMERARQEASQKGRELADLARKNIAAGGAPPDPSLFRESLKAMRAEQEATLLSFLSPAQRARLEQIRLQQEGPLAVARPEIQEKLNILPEQSVVIQSIVAELNEARGQIAQRGREMFSQLVRPPDADVDQKAMRARMQSREFDAQMEKTQTQMQKLRQQSDELERQAVQQLSRVLTKRQKLAFNKMLGEPFRLDPPKSPQNPGSGASPKEAGNAKAAPAPASKPKQ